MSRAPSERSAEQAATSDCGPPGRVEGVAAVVAAAGFSSRMGRFKPLLPWRRGTVIEAVAAGLAGGGASPVYIVTGHRGAEIAERLTPGAAVAVSNPDYRKNEMLRSYQVGIEALRRDGRPVQGTLLALGDQPHIPAAVIRQITDRARARPEAVVVPSYMRRRGHPVYLPQRFFPKLLSLESGQSLRNLLQAIGEEIVYEVVESDCVRRDMDLPAEYESLRAQFEWTE
ncbi:MAG: nucleotidyltransferase family protein [Caldilineaceae bacterium SB0661_bin_32]|uniref:Nucleotidyltransferase family protein n=1 Tax=Caldilineaceae bacterium SB0661_bin_32 TaxID=2605255 RepID=A0A6B1D265_9CHLR|nr:nucleotidyltransferase family protein [Caldilineaceae bacterium SB0661_bin_32]